MELIIVSGEDDINGEASLVNTLLKKGLHRFHLRKHHLNKDETRQYLDHIDAEVRPSVVLHQHHELAESYGLGGIHFNSKWPFRDSSVTKNGKTFSSSLHSLRELEETPMDMDYVFLGPVFKSISKPGYESYFTAGELMDTLTNQYFPFKIYAIGGMDTDKASLIKRWGFNGMAVLGSFWNQFMRKGEAGALEKFNQLMEAVQHE